MPGEVPAVRSIVAIAAGFFATTVMSLGGDLAFRRLSPGSFDAQGHPSSDGTLFVTLGYEALFVLVAGYVTARLAIRRIYAHALGMAAIVLLARAFTVLITWGTAPLWFQLGVLVLIVPMAMLGAKLGELRSSS
jgi:hypothetical protein